MSVPSRRVGIAQVAGIALAAGFALADVAAAQPVLLEVRPAEIEPQRPAVLELVGSGFVTGTEVRIETARPGRFLPYRPDELSESRCTVRLPLGFGATPERRAVFVRTPDGAESERLTLRIVRGAASQDEEPDPEEPAPDPADAEPVDAEPVDPEPGPTVDGLWPSPLPALRPASLEISGQGFEDDSEVWIQVNVHAGSSRLPQFEMRRFDAERIDETTLEVRFERGFYPAPSSRRLVVVQPDGRRSNEVFLVIAPFEDSAASPSTLRSDS